MITTTRGRTAPRPATDRTGAAYEPVSAQVTIARDGLRELVPGLAGAAHGSSVGPDPRAVDVIHTAVAPDRGAVVEHLTDAGAAAIRVGWRRDGRAAITTGHDVLTITATRLQRLPALLAQLLRIEPRPAEAGRTPTSTTAGALDRALARRSPTLPTLDPGAGRCCVDGAWRITAGWSGHPADRSITIVDTGDHGLWQCQVDDEPTAPHGDDRRVELAPLTADEMLAIVGDVITGRTASVAEPPRARLG